MNFLRTAFSILVWLVILGVMLLIAAFIPAVQTWMADWALHRAGVQGTIGDLSAAFGKIEADQVQLDSPDGTFKGAVVQAAIPLTGLVFGHHYHFKNLTAKGWTLTIKPSASRAPEEPDETAARAMAVLLGGWKLPYDLTVDHADLEGDIVVLGPKGHDPARIHLKLNGGGLEPGRPAQFAIETTGALADPSLPIFAITAQGQLFVTVENQAVSRMELKAHLSPRGSSIPNDLHLEGDLAAIHSAGAIRYTADFAMAGRHFVALDAQLAEATGQITGHWKANLKDTDMPLFLGDQTIPTGAATGEGRFEADPAAGRVRLIGQIHATMDHLGSLLPTLERVGAVVVTADFDATHQANKLRVAKLSVTAGHDRPWGTAELLQPFEVDEKTGDYHMDHPAAEWARGSAQAVPMAWLAGLTGSASFTGGAVSGHWTIRGGSTGWTVRTDGPWRASHVAVAWNGTTGPADLDWSLSGDATSTATGWAMNWSPLLLSDAHGPVAQITAVVIPPVAEGVPAQAKGRWSAQLPALAAHLPAKAQRWLAGQSAAGDFAITLSDAPNIDGKFKVLGRTPGHQLEATVHAEGSGSGAFNFTVPLKLTLGPGQTSELETEGSWSGYDSARLRVKLFSKQIAGENLGPLAAWLVGAGEGSPFAKASGDGPGRLGTSAISDPGMPGPPFWGSGTGSILFQFDTFTYQGSTYKDVGGTLEYDAKSFRLDFGRVKFGAYTINDTSGAITYDPTAAVPYQASLKALLGDIAADKFLPPAKHDDDPLLEGKFTVQVGLIGEGRTKAELLGAIRPVFNVTSKGGIIRLLKTDVGAALPQHATTVGDEVGSVGSKLGSFIGMHGQIGGKNPVSDTAQNILEVTYDLQEIGFDQASFTAITQPDGAIDLKEIKIVAADETFTGSGRIAAAPQLALNLRPISFDWQLGFRGHVAELMAKGKLLTYQKDQPGFATFSPALHTGGTLLKPEMSQWHDLLVQAALIPDPPKKKK